MRGDPKIVRVFAQQAPATELGHEPHAVGQVRQVDLARAMKAHGVRVMPAITQTISIIPHEAWFYAIYRCIEVIAAAEQLRGTASIFIVLFNKTAGFQNSHDQRPCGVGVLLDKLTGAAEHFFRVIGPDRLRRRQGKAKALIHSAGAPGFADAAAVDTPGL